MPSSPKIPKETILQHALQMLIREGYCALNIKALAKEIGCSTQPISWHFGNMDGLRRALLEYALQYAKEKQTTSSSGMAAFYEAGTAYIDIAFDEPRLFQYLYMNNNEKVFIGGFDAITDTTEGNIVKAQIAQQLDINIEEVEIFCRNMMIYTHGLASFIAAGLITVTKQEVYEMIRQSAKGFLSQINAGLRK